MHQCQWHSLLQHSSLLRVLRLRCRRRLAIIMATVHVHGLQVSQSRHGEAPPAARSGRISAADACHCSSGNSRPLAAVINKKNKFSSNRQRRRQWRTFSHGSLDLWSSPRDEERARLEEVLQLEETCSCDCMASPRLNLKARGVSLSEPGTSDMMTCQTVSVLSEAKAMRMFDLRLGCLRFDVSSYVADGSACFV